VACDVAAPPPTPRPIPTPVRKEVAPTVVLPTPAPEPGSVTRVLLEAEDFVPAGAAAGTSPSQGWRAITVGQGNYMVDSIGASHVSGEELLHAPADADGARATIDAIVPRGGHYKLWARYEYPFRDYHVAFAVIVDQPGRGSVRLEYGRSGAKRLWFFNLPDAPWHDLPYGVEGLVAEAHQVELAAGALDEGGAQLRHQVAVAADGGGERGVQRSGIIGHERGKYAQPC
jgi:hypothetical protein